MGFTSAWHWVIVLLVILIVFGAGKLPRVMGDVAKGIKNFKSGLKDEDDTPAAVTGGTGSEGKGGVDLRSATDSRPTAS